MSKSPHHRSLATRLRNRLRDVERLFRALRREGRLAWLRGAADRMTPDQHVSIGKFSGRITDPPNGYIQYKDLFVRQIYGFSPDRDDPVIIDGGSNIGMSIFYFKQRFPRARVVGFEADPEIFQVLRENVHQQGLTGVELVNAALGPETGTASFTPDGEAGGQVSGDGSVTVQVQRLSDYLDQPIDFLKLNIEGAELPVLKEAAARGRLTNVRELVIEYHGWPGGHQCLGDILNLLNEHGFRYLVHDFDNETCGSTKPPFRLSTDTTWFCLVYGTRAHARTARQAA